MLNIGPLELMVIFLIALIVVGPSKLPDLGKTIGKGLREFRKAQDEVRQSLQMDELKDVKREITDAQRGVRDAMRFETPKSERPKVPDGAVSGADGAGAAGPTPAAQEAADPEPVPAAETPAPPAAPHTEPEAP